ncbi:MAG: linear amide C-N hydrolase [Acidobacteria bacterium]|nr:linear amide C-N hydrolase [Acidobacteriota bacterium]
MAKSSFAVFLALLILTANILPCTTFCVRTKDEVFVGHNYDYDTGVGLLITNKRGVAKVSTTEDDGNPARWISKYGSVTFNQFGRENPNGGMNEKGLVVELMWLSDTEYPKEGKEPTIDLLEWIQYQLDTASTVAAALKNAAALRVDPQLPGIKLHYLVADATGNAAVVEYLGGRLIVRTGPELPKPILTNNTYDSSLAALKATPLDKAKSDGSFDRFIRAAHGLDAYDGKDPIKYSFSVLDNVRSEHFTSDDDTVWSVVYDQRSGVIHFKTQTNAAERIVDARKLDYSCGTPPRIFDINSKDAGDVTAQFTLYSRKANRDLLDAAFNGSSMLKFVPAALRDAAASYPEEFKCVKK